MSNTFEVIEVVSVLGRKDVLVVLESLTGDAYSVRGTLCSPQISGRWRITSVLPGNPSAPASRIAIGLDGPMGLAPGMLLTDAQ